MSEEKKPRFEIKIIATQIRPMHENFKDITNIRNAKKELRNCALSSIGCWYFKFSKPKIRRLNK